MKKRAIAVVGLAIGVAALGLACGSSSDSGTKVDGDASTEAAPAADAAVPTIAESCATLCARKTALACAKDPPAANCEPTCNTDYAHPGCEHESAVVAACAAAGTIVCSVDQESTPTAPCGPEIRAQGTCLASHPEDAGH